MINGLDILCSNVLKGLNLLSLNKDNLSQPLSIKGTEYDTGKFSR